MTPARSPEDADRPGGARSPGEGNRPVGADLPGRGRGLEAVDRADYDPAYDPGAPVQCEVCDGEMFYTAACKLKCPRCGYTRDCSDP